MSGFSNIEHKFSHFTMLSYTVGIWSISEETDEQAIGSGVILDVGRRRFIVSAWHCLARDPVILTHRSGITKSGRPPETFVPILRRNGDAELDIGYAEVSPDCEIVTAQKNGPAALDQLYLHPLPEPARVHVCGTPKFSEEIDEKKLAYYCSVGVFITDLIGADDDYLLFDYSKDGIQWNPAVQAMVPFDTKTPHGFSGGGVWVLGTPNPDKLFTPTMNVRLVAIQSRWQSDRRHCRAVRVRHLLRLLHADYEDLRDVIAETFDLEGCSLTLPR